ncbi:MAG: hypothetical protein OWQ48_00525 [Desulfurococcus sp.]|nr:hypothetical protein [Desulfurococcus sp.]
MNTTLPRILLTLIIIGSLVQLTLVNTQQSEWVLEGYSYKSRTGGNVYPGSSATVLTVDYRYTGLNTALSPHACLSTPEGFMIRGAECTGAVYPNGTYATIIYQGDVARFTFTLDVSRDVTPGDHYFTLNISYYVGGERRTYTTLLKVSISPYPPLLLAVDKAYFTPYSYAGSNPVSLYLEVLNNGATDVTSMDLTLRLPSEYFTPPVVNATYTGRIAPSEAASVVFSGIEIKPYTPPGVYKVLLEVSARLETSDGVSYRDSTILELTVSVESAPQVDLRVLDYSLTAQYPLPGLNNTGLRLLLQSLEPTTLRIVYMEAEFKGASTGNGSSRVIVEVGQVLSYMDTVELRVIGLNTAENTSIVEADILLFCMVNREGAWYPALHHVKLAIPLLSLAKLNVSVSSVSWLTAEAFPGSTNLGLTVTILNAEGFSLRDIEAVLLLPEGFKPSEVVSRNNMVNPYSLAEISFTGIDIAASTSPGLYRAPVILKGFIVNSDGSTRYVELTLSVSLVVLGFEERSQWIPRLELADYYWGEVAPAYVYPGNPRAALTVVLANTGLYQASNIVVEIQAPSDVKPILHNATCTTLLTPGSTCQAVFYLDLSNASPGLKLFNLTARYLVDAFNTKIAFNSTLSFKLLLPEYRAGSGLAVAYSSWESGNPVYPGEKGVVYTISIANLEPYPVYSMWIHIEPPLCFKIHEGFDETVYVPGPLNSLQVYTVSYTLDAFCEAPGSYTGYVSVDYYVQYAGGGYRKSIREPLVFTISDPSDAVEVVYAGWLSGAPIMGEKGVSYYIVLRNKEFPSLANPILILHLPPGFTDASTNTGEAVATPLTVIPGQQLQAVLQGTGLANILQAIQQASSQRQLQAGRGDVVVFTARINIVNATSGSYSVPFTLSFTDHWGYVYSLNSTLTMRLELQPPLISVRPVTPVIYFVNGSSILDIEVSNEYSASVYNVYVALIPSSSNAIPQGTVKYVDEIKGNSSVRLRYELIYNPVSISMGGGVTVTPTSAVFTVTLMYKDSYGYTRTVNTTISAVVKPFISIEVTPDTTARYYNESRKLTVSGILLNSGLTQARSVYVKAVCGEASGYSFIGDIDPSSQIPFRVDLSPAERPENCSLIIEFKDEYNSLYTVSQNIPVQLVAGQPQQLAAPSGSSYEIYHVVVVVVVSLFLAGVFFILYRRVGRH